jgi:hypothetical protein
LKETAQIVRLCGEQGLSFGGERRSARCAPGGAGSSVLRGAAQIGRLEA